MTFADCRDEEHEHLTSTSRAPHEHLTSTLAGRHAEASHAVYSANGCPDGHPVPVPQLQIAIDYPPVGPDGLSLASGSILTGHADFWNVWDQAKLDEEVRSCLNREFVCGVANW